MIGALAAMLPAVAPRAHAQCPAGWVPGVGVPGAFDGHVWSLAVLSNGDVIVGGGFTRIGGVAADHIARYNPATGAWSPLGSGVNNTVVALAVLPQAGGEDVIAGGLFQLAGGAPANHIARYSFATDTWSALGAGLAGGSPTESNAVVVLPREGGGNDVVVGGDFATAGGVAASNIARYDPDTGAWSALASAMNDRVVALAVLPPSGGGGGGGEGVDLIVGGDFTTVEGISANRIARYDPAGDAWSGLRSGTNSTVFALAVLPNAEGGGGDVIAGGLFTTVGGLPANRVARYSPSADAWFALGSGTGGLVRALAVLPNAEGGDVLAGGFFTAAGGAPASRIALYRPSTNMWSALGSGTNEAVTSLATIPGEEGADVIVGGFFTAAGGQAANKIARYTFGGAAPSISSQPESAGACPSAPATFSVTAAGGGGGPFTYRWQWTAPAINPAWSDVVEGLNVDSGGQPVFTAAGAAAESVSVQRAPGTPYPYADFTGFALRVVVVNACGSVTSDEAMWTICAADINCDGMVSVQDFLAFLTAYSDADPVADFTGDGVVNVQDFLAFLTAYAAGCA